MTDEAFDRLFRLHYPSLYRQAYTILRDREDSRDVVNDVFTHLLDNNRPTPDVSVAYLMTMVRNRSIDLLRHRKIEDEARLELIRCQTLAVTPDEAHDQRIADIRQYIQTQLTPQTRRVLQMCYDEKKTYHETATELGVSIQAVNKHISQALRRLRERFGDHRTGPGSDPGT